jgi:hypothetical protein
MDAEHDATTLRHRYHSFKEVRQVCPQRISVDTVIVLQQLFEFRHRIGTLSHFAVDEALRLDKDGINQRCFLLFADGLLQPVNLLQILRAVIRFGPLTLQDPAIKVDIPYPGEVEGGGSIGKLPVQVGPYPINCRHEVVADGFNTRCA